MNTKDQPKNDCFKCPHRGSGWRGSAHISCNLMDSTSGYLFSLLLVANKTKAIEIIEGQPPIEFDQYGVQNGWCFWPVNFDPTWITCKIKIKEDAVI